MPATILIGCGGSGIRTLLRLNQLLAEDPYWRQRVYTDLYYMVVDTDLCMLEEFEVAVSQQFDVTYRPMTKVVRLAANLNSLAPVVLRHFIDPFRQGGNDVGERRLYEHWWNQGRLKPFHGEKVSALTQGAGQCPPVACFLTWLHLDQIGREFADLVRQIVSWRSHTGDPLEGANVWIVAGLAGGTGRGCWQLVAFKAWEVLLRHNTMPAQVAFLFDASTFHDIMRRHPSQALPMKVNALTGISELSCWMRNIRGQGDREAVRFRYNLPHMRSPGDQAMDVLNVDLSLDSSAPAPVDSACLIFGRSEYTVLDDSEQYQAMVGTALYAALSKRAVSTLPVNGRLPCWSLGAASFEVNATLLRQYFERKARVRAARALSEIHREAVGKAVDEFLKRTRLALGLTAHDRSAFEPDEKGTFLQQACHFLLEAYGSGMAALDDALRGDDPAEVWEVTQRIVVESPTAAEEAVEAAVCAIEQPPLDIARQTIVALLQETSSVETARGFLVELTSNLLRSLDVLPAPGQMKLDPSEEPKQVLETLTGREYRLFRRHFKLPEWEDYTRSVSRAILYANYGRLVEALGKAFKAWVCELDRWRRNAEITTRCCERVLAKFMTELRALGGEPEDVFDLFFTDPDRPEKGIPANFSVSRFCRRELRPVLVRGDDDRLLGQPQLGKDGGLLLREALLEKALDADSDDEIDHLGRNLEQQVRASVHLPEHFIRDHFAIRKVIGDLRRAWQKRLNEIDGLDELREAADRFQSFFGVPPRRDGDEYLLDDEDDLILGMAASLAATCKPFWRLRGQEAGAPRAAVGADPWVSLFLPPSEKGFDTRAAAEKVQSLLPDGVHLDVYTDRDVPPDGGESRGNPYLMMAYATEGVPRIGDTVASLDYWREDPRVLRWLQRCEDPGGESIFSPDDDNRGLGFVDPLYVRHEMICALRWKPWLEVMFDPGPGPDELRQA